MIREGVISMMKYLFDLFYLTRNYCTRMQHWDSQKLEKVFRNTWLEKNKEFLEHDRGMVECPLL